MAAHKRIATLLGLVAAATAVPRVEQRLSAADLVISTFDGAKGTSQKWVAENDPVMGGRSVSTFSDEASGVAEWKGEVKVVPFLHAPGFCTARTNGASFPDMAAYAGMKIVLRAKAGTALQRYQLQMTSSVRGGPKQGEFQADFNISTTASADFTEFFVPFASFTERWRGEPEGGAPSRAQLAAITQIGIGSDGIAGAFDIEVKRISVSNGASPGPAPGPAAAGVDLVTFGEKATTWRVTNDPVMGGLSHSSFHVDRKNATGLFTGEVKIVPKLKAPGFCNAETSAGVFRKFADASKYDGLEITLKSLGPLTSFKSSFGSTSQQEFGSFKAGFNVTMSEEWQTVTIPWDAYTNKWSDFTGGCHDHGAVCCDSAHPEVCPTATAKANIGTMGIWGEGSAGAFTLVLKSIRAVKISV